MKKTLRKIIDNYIYIFFGIYIITLFMNNTTFFLVNDIVKRSIKERMLLLETEYKSVYKVSFDDVLWVKTGNRWPKGIYELLKGRVKLNEEEK